MSSLSTNTFTKTVETERMNDKIMHACMSVRHYILGDPVATSRDDAILLGKRYFGAKVYFRSRQAACLLLM